MSDPIVSMRAAIERESLGRCGIKHAFDRYRIAGREGPDAVADYDAMMDAVARAAWAYALAALQEPNGVRDCRSDQLNRHIDWFLRDFARLHGLDGDCGAVRPPSVAARLETAPDTVPEPDGPIPASGGALAARRTPGGHAA